MKILDKVQEIINQHELKPIVLPDEYKNVYKLIRDYPELAKDYQTQKNDVYFMNKFYKRIPQGWYGFSIGSPIVPVWCEILDKILNLCIIEDPDFEIHQIKIKFGGIRFYCESQVIEDLFDVELLIERTLYDRALIY